MGDETSKTKNERSNSHLLWIGMFVAVSPTAETTARPAAVEFCNQLPGLELSSEFHGVSWQLHDGDAEKNGWHWAELLKPVEFADTHASEPEIQLFLRQCICGFEALMKGALGRSVSWGATEQSELE